MENIVFYDFPVGEEQCRFTKSIAQICGGHWTSYGHKKLKTIKFINSLLG